MRLRTLKNFDFSYPEVSEEEYQKIFDKEKKEELRIEAIKDIKELQKQWSEHAEAKINNLVLPYSKTLIDYIKWKFNIKEKDLK